MSFSNSVILKWQNGRGNARHLKHQDARIVEFPVTLGSGVHSRAIFVLRKGMRYDFAAHMDYGEQNRQ